MKNVERAIAALAVLSALFTLAFVGYSFLYSPQNPVASEIHFEAYRVARKLPLYVDPFVGAWEDGAPPSRYYVLYTPIFPTLVGMVARVVGGASLTLATVQWVGRTIAVGSWLALQILVVVFAPKERRKTTLLATLLGAGIYFVARNAASMSPDTFATLLVCTGVLRAVVKDEIDPIAAVLLIAGPFVKPSCLGGVAGAAIVLLAQRRPGWLRGFLAGIGTFVVFLGICHLASDGAWLTHITSSTGQPLTLTRWVQEMGSRSVVLGIPHAVVAWVAYERKTTWLALGPLLGSLAWATFMMAKHGSGSHYWLEPTTLAVIVISRMPAATGERTVERYLPIGALVFAVLVAVTSWPPYLEEPSRVRWHDAKFAALKQRIPRRPGDFILSSDFEVEMQLDEGHISVPAWQSGFLARAGKFPKEAWQADLVRPEVTYVVSAVDPRLPPGKTNDEIVELSPFYDILKEPLLASFDFYDDIGGMFVFKRR